MAKCILLVRVSTQAQDYDEQERVIYDMAKADGYSDADIIPICEKESGRMLSEEERAGLNRMKEAIENDPAIDRVYCFELDRIGRRKTVLFSIVEYLVNRKINLIIKEPSRIELLKKDGTLDEASEMVITLFAQLAEAEMRNKLARMMRGKMAKKRANMFIGGQVPLGYVVDSDGNFIVDPHGLVLKIFTMYSSGKYSYVEIAREMKAVGFFPSGMEDSTLMHRVRNILCNRQYLGEKTKKGYVFPQIITEELFDKCHEISEDRAKYKKGKEKKLNEKRYALKGLVKCQCGRCMTVSTTTTTYRCLHCSTHINFNALENSAWFRLVPTYGLMTAAKSDQDRLDALKAIDDLHARIKTSEANVKTYGERIDAIDDAVYVTGKLDPKKADRMRGELNSKIDKENKSIAECNVKIAEITKMNSHIGEDRMTADFHALARITDQAIRYDIFHEIVEKVTPVKEHSYIHRVTMTLKNGREISWRVNAYTKALEVEEGKWIKPADYQYREIMEKRRKRE